MGFFRYIFLILSFLLTSTFLNAQENNKKLVYITPDINIPFWRIMSEGIKTSALKNGYDFEVLSSKNQAKIELQSTIKAIRQKAVGIVVSPTNSSACVTILKLAKKANIPVVISDIGTDSGEFVSYISSNNKKGAYDIGKVLTKKMIELDYKKGSVGIIAIPQKRLNGQARTAGFMKALSEANIKGADIKQWNEWTLDETYKFTKEFVRDFPNLKAIWLQSSNLVNGSIKALKDLKKEKEIILVAFDAEPEFLELIPKGIIIGSGMQQPFLMGEEAGNVMHKYLNGQKVKKDIQLPILTITTENISDKLHLIKRNVLGTK